MGVQKSKRSCFKRKLFKLYFYFKKLSLSIDKETNKIHLRHHITNDNYYKGKKII